MFKSWLGPQISIYSHIFHEERISLLNSPGATPVHALTQDAGIKSVPSPFVASLASPALF